MKRTDEQLINEAKKMVNGKNFRVAKRVSEYVDGRGLPHREIFRAVEFTAEDGTKKFIGEIAL